MPLTVLSCGRRSRAARPSRRRVPLQARVGRGCLFSEAAKESEARELIDEFRDIQIMHGFRGRPPWDLEHLARILVSAGRLAAAWQDWTASLDLDPVIHCESGYAVVDGLLLVKPGAR